MTNCPDKICPGKNLSSYNLFSEELFLGMNNNCPGIFIKKIMVQQHQGQIVQLDFVFGRIIPPKNMSVNEFSCNKPIVQIREI